MGSESRGLHYLSLNLIQLNRTTRNRASEKNIICNVLFLTTLIIEGTWRDVRGSRKSRTLNSGQSVTDPTNRIATHSTPRMKAHRRPNPRICSRCSISSVCAHAPRIRYIQMVGRSTNSLTTEVSNSEAMEPQRCPDIHQGSGTISECHHWGVARHYHDKIKT